MSGPDKPKVIGEEWSDERVKSFLAITPYDSNINPDFNALIKAYQAMIAEDFDRFVGFFVEAGGISTQLMKMVRLSWTWCRGTVVAPLTLRHFAKPAQNNGRGRELSPGSTIDGPPVYWTSTSIALGSAGSALVNVSDRMPSLKLARILFSSTFSGRVNRRRKLP